MHSLLCSTSHRHWPPISTSLSNDNNIKKSRYLNELLKCGVNKIFKLAASVTALFPSLNVRQDSSNITLPLGTTWNKSNPSCDSLQLTVLVIMFPIHLHSRPNNLTLLIFHMIWFFWLLRIRLQIRSLTLCQLEKSG